MNWYYIEQNQQKGPVSNTEWNHLIATGIIQGQTLVWTEGMPNWVPFIKIKQTGFSAQDGSAVCHECGKITSSSEALSYSGFLICADCKPVFQEKIKEGAVITSGFVFAGFWMRFLAKVIDNMILQFVFTILQLALGSLIGFGMGGASDAVLLTTFAFAYLIGIAVSASYSIFFNGKYSATPGKMILKLKVVTADGQNLTYGKATGRFFAELLSGFTLSIGYIIAGFDEEKRALHDRICNTRVITTQ